MENRTQAEPAQSKAKVFVSCTEESLSLKIEVKCITKLRSYDAFFSEFFLQPACRCCDRCYSDYSGLDLYQPEG